MITNMNVKKSSYFDPTAPSVHPDEPVPKSEIALELDAMRQAVARLHENLAEMEARLAPVLADVPSPSCDVTPTNNSTSLGRVLYDIRYEVDNAAQQVRSLISRLGL